MKTHVVCTWYRHPNGTIITHAYGPYTPQKASAERRAMMRDHKGEIEAGTFHVSANRIIDVEALNG